MDQSSSPITRRQLLLRAQQLLEQGVRSPDADPGAPAFEAKQLLYFALGLTPAQYLMDPQAPVEPTQAQRLLELAERRAGGYPLQYLLGEWEFYGLPFWVGEGVLIPRADTETLVDAALELLDGCSAPAVADLCSGSGCIPAALSCNLPDSARLWAVELSPAAFSYLERNLQRLGCHNVCPVLGDALSWQPPQPLDLITSNPPYLSAAEMEELSCEVRFEPALALEAPEEGLWFYRNLARRGRELLRPGGALALEVGYRQAEAVCRFLEENGFTQIETRADLCGVQRVVLGRTPLL